MKYISTKLAHKLLSKLKMEKKRLHSGYFESCGDLEQCSSKRGLFASLTKVCCLRRWLVTKPDWSLGLEESLIVRTGDRITTSNTDRH